MRNVTELSKLNGKVYVYLRDEVIARRFLQDAENEGFTFGDGEKPTARFIVIPCFRRRYLIRVPMVIMIICPPVFLVMALSSESLCRLHGS